MHQEIKRERKKRKSHLPKASANVIKFCEILDNLPINFKFELNNVSKDFDGSWAKMTINETTAWQSGSRILFNSSFFHKRNDVLQAIDREGLPVRKLYFSDAKSKITPLLTKEKIKELYYKQKKSLQEIAKEYGCTKQWVFLLMEKYELKRRTRSEALKEAVRQNKVALIKPKR